MFEPAVDMVLTVFLPGEVLRAPITRIIDRDTVFITLDSTPLNPAKQHTYRKGDMIACRRATSPLGERWEAMEERELYQAPERQAEPEPEPAPKAAPPPRPKAPPPPARKAAATPPAPKLTEPPPEPPSKGRLKQQAARKRYADRKAVANRKGRR